MLTDKLQAEAAVALQPFPDVTVTVKLLAAFIGSDLVMHSCSCFTGPGDAQALPALPAPEPASPTQQAQQPKANSDAMLPDQSPSQVSANGDTAVKAELSDAEDDEELETAELQVR